MLNPRRTISVPPLIISSSKMIYIEAATTFKDAG